MITQLNKYISIEKYVNIIMTTAKGLNELGFKIEDERVKYSSRTLLADLPEE